MGTTHENAGGIMIHEGDADIAEELKGDVEGYLCQLKPFRRPGATSFFGLLEYKYFKEKRDKKEVKVLYEDEHVLVTRWIDQGDIVTNTSIIKDGLCWRAVVVRNPKDK